MLKLNLINSRFWKTLLVAFLSAFTVFFSIVPPVFAQDQPSITLKNTTLSIFPEYDDPMNLGVPSLLIMYEGQIISNNLSQIAFLVPEDAQMYSAGSGPRDQYQVGGLLDVNGASNISGWKQVSFVPKTNFFVIEYYLPIPTQPDRSIHFDFRTLYPVSGMKVIVQEPGRATDFKLAPEGRVGNGPDGFKIHTFDVPSVTPDQPLLYDITYNKKDNNPTLGSGGAVSATSSNTNLVLIVIGVIVVLGAVLFFGSQLRAKPARAYSSRSQRRQAMREVRKGQAPGQEQGKGKSKFCRNCGKPLQGNDRFCPSCGESVD